MEDKKDKVVVKIPYKTFSHPKELSRSEVDKLLNVDSSVSCATLEECERIKNKIQELTLQNKEIDLDKILDELGLKHLSKSFVKE